MGELLVEVALGSECTHDDAVGCELGDEALAQQGAIGLDAYVELGEHVLHHELHVHACLAYGCLSGTCYHPVGVGGVAEELLHRVGGCVLQVVPMQGDVVDMNHVCGRIYAHRGIGLPLVGCIGTEGVGTLFAPILQGSILPSCTVAVVADGLVVEGEGVVVPHAVAPTPYSHRGEVCAELVGMAGGGIVDIAADEADWQLALVVCSGYINQHIVLGTATQQHQDTQQICLPMSLHVVFSFLVVAKWKTNPT